MDKIESQKAAFVMYASCILLFFNIALMQIMGEQTSRLVLFGWLGCISLGALYFLIEEKWKGDKERDAENHDCT